MLYILLNLLVSNSYAGDLVKVAVIDTGLDLNDPRFSGKLCKTGHKDFTNTGIKDTIGHGTHVAGLIAKNASPGYCMIILKYYTDGGGIMNSVRSILAMKEAENLGVDLVNYSAGGADYQAAEYLTMNNSKALFLLAAGNNNEDVRGNFYPASYHLPNSLVVGALGRNGKKASFSNFGPFVDVWQIGEDMLSYLPGNREGIFSGTSMATGVETGKLLNKSFETLNQIRNVCIRTSGKLHLCSR